MIKIRATIKEIYTRKKQDKVVDSALFAKKQFEKLAQWKLTVPVSIVRL